MIGQTTNSIAVVIARGFAVTVTIELSPEIEAGLSALASAQGLDVSAYVQNVLKEQLFLRKGSPLSPAERAAAWRNVSNLPVTPLLSDDAISRESMYSPRG